jgi:hypothetical protein
MQLQVYRVRREMLFCRRFQRPTLKRTQLALKPRSGGRLRTKTKWIVLVVARTLEPLAQAHATVLPDVCGDDKVKFDVKTQKDQPAPVLPEAGKAQLVLIENNDRQVTPFSYATIRFGMDGAGVAAENGSSCWQRTPESITVCELAIIGRQGKEEYRCRILHH